MRQLLADLQALVEPATRGDPQSPLPWSSKSNGKICVGLRDLGHQVGQTLTRELLHRS
jgi:hypothetical protein